MKKAQPNIQRSFKDVYSVSICTNLIKDIVQRSMAESESALFYKMQIEKCEQYIKNVQQEATRDWQIPAKPCDFQNVQDVQFFHSEFCLKNKLSNLKNHKEEQNKRSSFHSKKLSIRSIRSRCSSTNGFSWSQNKYGHFKQINSEKLKSKTFSRQLSLQKLVLSNKAIQITETEKQLRQAVTINNPNLQEQNRKKITLKSTFSKQKPKKDSKIPMLIEMAYKITNNEDTKMKQYKSFEQNKPPSIKSEIKARPSIQINKKLKINEYEPHMNHIKINSWKKFNEMIVDNCPAPNTKPIKQIKYYAGKVE